MNRYACDAANDYAINEYCWMEEDPTDAIDEENALQSFEDWVVEHEALIKDDQNMVDDIPF